MALRAQRSAELYRARVLSFFHQPWLYIEVYLFMCDKIAVPHSESVERWKADWDDLKAQSTLMETASKVAELASKHLNEPVQSLGTPARKDVASKVHKMLLACLDTAHTERAFN